MKINNIYSTRKVNQEVYSDLIYEWEDVFSAQLHVKIYSFKYERLFRKFFKALSIIRLNSAVQRLDSLRRPKRYTLVIELRPRDFFSFQVFKNKIPYIIDFNFGVDIENFTRVYKNCPIILISSLEAFNYLKSKKCLLNLAFLPLGISDKYIENNVPIKKKYDVVIVRKNSKLLQFTKKYAETHPSFEYVMRTWGDSGMYKKNVYVSNRQGILGEYSDRNKYWSLLRESKIALYSTPGIDEEETIFMNHITPSLFEFLAAGCMVIARLPENAEIAYFKFGNNIKKVDHYSEFETMLDSFLNLEQDIVNDSLPVFLESIRASKRADMLAEIIGSIENG